MTTNPKTSHNNKKEKVDTSKKCAEESKRPAEHEHNCQDLHKRIDLISDKIDSLVNDLQILMYNDYQLAKSINSTSQLLGALKEVLDHQS
jgi:hypothetical protein